MTDGNFSLLYGLLINGGQLPTVSILTLTILENNKKRLNFGGNSFKFLQIKCYSGKDGRQELELYGPDRAG
jgi:hypothetical protein